MRGIVLMVIGGLLTACGGGDGTPSETPRSAEPQASEVSADAPAGDVDGYFVTDDSPDPFACASDDECGYGGVLADDGCCWSFRAMNAAPMTTAYRDWSSARHVACDEGRCPSPPVPTEPPACLFTVRCEAGRCVNDCER